MSEVVKRVFVDEDGRELDIETQYVTRKIPVPTVMRVPLYVNGIMVGTERLVELGLTIREYTQEELDAKECAALYAANPDLAKRVREYKGYLDQIGILDYGATTDDIEEAIAISTTIEDKEQYVLRIKTAFDNVVLNLQALDPEANSYTAWEKMPVLVANLPEETEQESEQPDLSEPIESEAEGAE